MTKKWLRYSVILLIVAALSYATAMMVIRLRVTERAYAFEEIKSMERELREEQFRLQAEISRRAAMSSTKDKWKALGYGYPDPKQVITIP